MQSELGRGWLWLYNPSWREKPLIGGIGLHVAYFIFFSIVGCLSLWLSPKPHGSPPLFFIDALFSAISAVTETGLSSVPMHRFTIFDQVILLLLMLVGSHVFTSIVGLFLRRSYFPLSITETPMIPMLDIITEEPRVSISEGIKRVISMPILAGLSIAETPMIPMLDIITEEPRASINEGIKRVISMPILAGLKSYHKTRESIESIYSSPAHDVHKWGVINKERYSKQAMEANTKNLDMENKALVTMSWVTTGYFIVSLMLGFLVCQVSIMGSPNARAVLKASHVNTAFFSLFAVVSAIGNCGYILLDDNLVPLQRDTPMVLCLCALILIGSTMYAPTMRGLIWVLYKLTPAGERKSVYEYLLKERKRSFTHLFPREETWWLVSTVVAIDAMQILPMLALDWKSDALRGLGAAWYKLVAALFQSVCTRSGGMNVVNLSGFSSATLFVALAAMYTKTYPLHVYKQAKGLLDLSMKSKWSILKEQLETLNPKNCFLLLAILLICIFERDAIKQDPINFSLFNITFEVISAYGNAGLSIGYDCKSRLPVLASTVCINIAYSFCGKWNVGGKLILMIVMFAGRHQSLLIDIEWNTYSPRNKITSVA